MKRALVLVVPIVAVAVPAFAQQATPEDFGVPQQQQQPAAPAETAPAPAATPTIHVISQPPPLPAPASSTTPEQDEAKLKEFKPAIKVQLGYQYARLHSVPINAGRFRLGVGAQSDVQAHYFTFSSFVGATETERRVWDLRVG
jgi:hypothetical protein